MWALRAPSRHQWKTAKQAKHTNLHPPGPLQQLPTCASSAAAPSTEPCAPMPLAASSPLWPGSPAAMPTEASRLTAGGGRGGRKGRVRRAALE